MPNKDSEPHRESTEYIDKFRVIPLRRMIIGGSILIGLISGGIFAAREAGKRQKDDLFVSQYFIQGKGEEGIQIQSKDGRLFRLVGLDATDMFLDSLKIQGPLWAYQTMPDYTVNLHLFNIDTGESNILPGVQKFQFVGQDRLFISIVQDGLYQITQGKNGKLIKEKISDRDSRFVASPDGKKIVFMRPLGEYSLYQYVFEDLENKKQLFSFNGSLTGISFSDDSNYVYWATKNKIYGWSFKDGTSIGEAAYDNHAGLIFPMLNNKNIVWIFNEDHKNPQILEVNLKTGKIIPKDFNAILVSTVQIDGQTYIIVGRKKKENWFVELRDGKYDLVKSINYMFPQTVTTGGYNFLDSNQIQNK